VLIESFGFLNPPHRQAAKRYAQCYDYKQKQQDNENTDFTFFGNTDNFLRE